MLEKAYDLRYRVFRARYEASVLKKLLFAFSMACLTGILAQVRFHLPWTEVPITGQTFAVLLSGILLGRWWGGISQAIYVGLGIAGVPWFSGFTSGVKIFTMGYLFGFILAALFVGFMTDSFIRSRGFLPMLGICLFANFALIHIPGLLWYAAFTGIWSPPILLSKCLLPFIPGDIIKAVIPCSVASKLITPKTSYSGEFDRNWR